MEISKVTQNSFKIKSKNATLIVDPNSKTDAEIVIVTSEENATIPENTKLVIEGPGEYEVGGLSIKGEAVADFMLYKIFDDQFSILFTSADSISRVKEEDEYDAVIIHATNSINKKDIAALSSDVVIVYGLDAPSENDTIKKLPRINLKKKEELKGYIVYLG